MMKWINQLTALILAAVVVATSSISAAEAQSPAAADDRVAVSREYWKRYTERLPIGSTVRVRTTSGERITAVLAIVDDQGITIAPKTRIPEAPRRVPFDQLRQIELKQTGSSTGKAIGIGVAIGVGAFFGMLAILAAAWSD